MKKYISKLVQDSSNYLSVSSSATKSLIYLAILFFSFTFPLHCFLYHVSFFIFVYTFMYMYFDQDPHHIIPIKNFYAINHHDYAFQSTIEISNESKFAFNLKLQEKLTRTHRVCESRRQKDTMDNVRSKFNLKCFFFSFVDAAPSKIHSSVYRSFSFPIRTPFARPKRTAEWGCSARCTNLSTSWICDLL